MPNIASEALARSVEFYEGFTGLKVAMDMDWIITFISESNPSPKISPGLPIVLSIKVTRAGLVSTAPAGQRMLFKVLAQELKESTGTVTELINYTYIRGPTMQSGSSISGEATAAFASYLVSDQAEEIHGKSIQLQSEKQLEEVGITI